MTFPVDPKCRAGFVPLIAGLALMCIAAFDPRDKATLPLLVASIVCLGVAGYGVRAAIHEFRIARRVT